MCGGNVRTLRDLDGKLLCPRGVLLTRGARWDESVGLVVRGRVPRIINRKGDRPMKHLGIDVHLKSTEICGLSEEGEVLRRDRISTTTTPSATGSRRRPRAWAHERSTSIRPRTA